MIQDAFFADFLLDRHLPSATALPPPLSFSTGDLCVVQPYLRRFPSPPATSAPSATASPSPISPLFNTSKLRFRLLITSNLRFRLFSTSYLRFRYYFALQTQTPVAPCLHRHSLHSFLIRNLGLSRHPHIGTPPYQRRSSRRLHQDRLQTSIKQNSGDSSSGISKNSTIL